MSRQVGVHFPGGTSNTAYHRFDGCRIRDFVPLLVERAASRSLDAAIAAGATTPATVPAAAPIEHHMV
ncbi:three-helix bundle dimerization domain-containing protein [Rhodococcus koreensis]|uniref:three-helix bundle dimerization domain-containing protein n=1 Tax=Rhodococcus koreensis TaxID=99653 RepID=UPI003B847735